ncbi:MAG: zf-HC2 domain-containing protein [Candidatus Aminicenantes bacterium]|nr:zf-HC2 domain-containing protein [Candidatus Aminicenantes bacterium]
MDCQKIEDLLSAYIENDLAQQRRHEVTRHLEQCENCRRLKEKMETLMHSFPDLEEDVPFFLKNRLLYIQEAQQDNESKYYYLKWVAAVIGTFILFLNLFYFTNIYPPANRALHATVSHIETIFVKTEALFEQLKESKNLLFSSFSKKNGGSDNFSNNKVNNKINKNNSVENNGGKHG